jgi:large subunit ribosomal protein L17
VKKRIDLNRLGRMAGHCKALHRNMVTSLFRHERITTSKAKAREVRRTAEKLVTRGRTDTVHNRRIAARMIADKAILAKLFTVLGPRYRERAGGYTRMLKLGYRDGDSAELVILELLDRPVKERSKAKRRRGTKAEPAAAAEGESKQGQAEAPGPATTGSPRKGARKDGDEEVSKETP